MPEYIFLNKLKKSKSKYHRAQANMPFEQKYEIIKKLQIIDSEMKRSGERKQGFK